LIGALSAVYGAVAAWRRRWYGRDASRRHRLGHSVVSVGNLRVGGSGKTPIVEYIARLLRDQGERPAILTRGYARRISSAGVTVVSDGSAIRAELDTAGDEPLMLARALPGVAVLVGADRYLSGVLAERKLASPCTFSTTGFSTSSSSGTSTCCWWRKRISRINRCRLGGCASGSRRRPAPMRRSSPPAMTPRRSASAG
jgi:tetraacyldisaccharide 4'-kinase